MPYLDATRKRYLDTGGKMTQPGDLTYNLTRALLRDADEERLAVAVEGTVKVYLMDLDREPRYADYATILGCLDSTWREYARRAPRNGAFGKRVQAVKDYAEYFYATTVAAYEDSKIEENGDVYVTR